VGQLGAWPIARTRNLGVPWPTGPRPKRSTHGKPRGGRRAHKHEKHAGNRKKPERGGALSWEIEKNGAKRDNRNRRHPTKKNKEEEVAGELEHEVNGKSSTTNNQEIKMMVAIGRKQYTPPYP